MRTRIIFVALMVSLLGIATQAQLKTPNSGEVYCSGMVTAEKIPSDTVVLSGEESDYKLTFTENDYVYINKGASQGVKVGDEFLVMRSVQYDGAITWFASQRPLTRAMGTVWEDEGRLKVVVAQPNVSIAHVEHSCDYLQRGDVVLPFEERPAPPLKSEDNFDRFAPVSGNKLGTVVNSRKFQMSLGTGDIIYVNLGSAQGMKPGDYFRIFRYQGGTHNSVYQTRDSSFAMYGFGAAPSKYIYKDVPREIEGEGIVLRVTPNSSTVLITFSLREIFLGDYVEVE
ncbi:MAG: hypothetical protein ACRD50_15575 [Candidatus Acidiferrales bacterium]